MEDSKRGYGPAAGPAASAAGGFGKKTCPRCGEVLYADMRVCYGCLYDFERSDNGPSELALPLDEPEGLEGPARGPGPLAAPSPPPPVRPPALLEPTRIPEPGFAPYAEEATTVLGARGAEGASGEGGPCLKVSCEGIEVLLPIPGRGLGIGRDRANDVVIRDRSVSRRHLRVVAAPGGVEAIDLGSTNPALFLGRPLAIAEVVPWGAEIRLGPATLTPCKG